MLLFTDISPVFSRINFVMLLSLEHNTRRRVTHNETERESAALDVIGRRMIQVTDVHDNREDQ